MAEIDKNGVDQINQHVKNPVVSIYDKLSSKNPQAFTLIKDEFDHIIEFVNKVNNEWRQPDGSQEPSVIVNNKVYTPAD